MKKWMFAALVAILAFAMTGCPGGDPSDDNKEWTVSFELGDHGTGVPPANRTVPNDFPITAGWLPAAPDSDDPGFSFAGWYLKHDTTTRAVGYVVTGDVVLIALWAPPVTITFYNVEGDTTPLTTIKIAVNTSLETAQQPLPTAVRAGEYQFNRWVFKGTTTTVDRTTPFPEDADVVGTWYSTSFTYNPTADAGAEKVRLTNGGMVIYEFDISSLKSGAHVSIDDLKKLDGAKITVKQQLNEASYNTAYFRAFRVYGPYAFNKNDIVVNQGSWSTGDMLNGDFKFTKDGMVIAKLNGNDANYDTASMLRFNKFHPYMIYNGTTDFGWGQGAGWSASAAEVTGAIEVNTWFDVAYPLDGKDVAVSTGGQSLGRTIMRLKEANAIGDLMPFDTNYDKVYFAFGPSTASPDSSITFLLKDVKLTLEDGTTVINGTIPNLSGNGTAAAPDQTFACYEDGSRLVNWRGQPTTAIVTREDTGTEATYNGPLDGADNGKVTGDNFFYVRLGNFQTPATFQTNSAATPAITGTFTGEFTKGPLTVTFPSEQAMLNIALTPSQQALLAKAENEVFVTLDGTTTGTNNFRFGLGDATKGSDWNITDLPAETFDNLFLDADGPKEVKLTGNARWGNGDAKFFMLQNRTAAQQIITINSIRIDFTPVPPEPCPCEIAGEMLCDGLFTMGDCTGECNCAVFTIIPNLNSFPGLVPAGGPGFGLMDDGGLFVYNRSADYHGVDLNIIDATNAAAGQIVLNGSTYYRIKVTGRAVVDSTLDLEAQIMRSQRPYSGNIYSGAAITGTDGAVVPFTVEVTDKTGDDLFYREDSTGADITGTPDQYGVYQGVRIRLLDKTSNSTTFPAFVIDTIEVYALSGSGGNNVGAAIFTFNK